MAEHGVTGKAAGLRVAVGWLVGGIVLALIVGALVGWALASWRGCRDATGCDVDWSAAEALGTWVGGLGTVAALVFAARQLALDQSARAAETARRIQEDQAEFERALEDAQQVKLSVITPWTSANSLREVQIHVHNDANEAPVFKVKGTSN